LVNRLTLLVCKLIPLKHVPYQFPMKFQKSLLNDDGGLRLDSRVRTYYAL